MRWLIDMGYNVLQRKAIMFAEKKKIHIYVGKIDDDLNKKKQKQLRIRQKGFMIEQFFIEKLMYKVQDDILSLRDEDEDVYLSLNLNQVYQEVQERLAHKHIFIKEYEMEGAILTMSLPSSQITVAKREIISFYWDKQ